MDLLLSIWKRPLKIQSLLKISFYKGDEISIPKINNNIVTITGSNEGV